MEKDFLKNTSRAMLFGGISAVLFEHAFINMAEHAHSVWRLDNPVSWIVITPLTIATLYYFFASDKKSHETSNTSN